MWCWCQLCLHNGVFVFLSLSRAPSFPIDAVSLVGWLLGIGVVVVDLLRGSSTKSVCGGGA